MPDTSDTLHLSGAKGGVSDTSLISWDTTWDNFCTRLSQSEVGTKDGAYFVRGPFNGTNTRNDNNITRAYVVILDGDSRMDPDTGELFVGAPHPSLVYEALRDLDIPHTIYTSHSHGAEGKGNRYRVVITCEMETPEELRAVVDWLIDQLHQAGVPLATVPENYKMSNAWYLPRIRSKDAEFLTYRHDTDETLDLPAIMEWWHAQQPPPPPTSDAAPPKARTANSPIGRYNAQHGTVEAMSDMLAQHDYVFTATGTVGGEASYRFLPPGSTSDSAGVVLFHADSGVWRAVSHHGEHDPLAQTDPKTGRALCHDAFGLFCILEHGGDESAALRAYKPDLSTPNATPDSPSNTDDTHADIDTERTRILNEFGTKHGVVMVEGKSLIVYRERDENTGEMMIRFVDRTNAATYYNNLRVPLANDSGDIEYKPIVPIWLASLQRKSYRQIHFTPVPRMVSGDTDLPNTKTFNMFTGLELTPRPGKCSLILDHIKQVWCKNNDESNEFVLDQMAAMFQFPQRQGYIVIVLKSAEGTGKNIILDILTHAWGPHAVVASKPGDLTGRFNGHLATAVLVFANEAVWGGDKSQEGALKSLITDDWLTVEKKFLPQFHVRNRTHLYVASNNDWAVPVGISDRRFFVLDVSEHRIEDFEYFDRLRDEINSGGAEAFVDYLLNRDISNFNPRDMPQINSAAKQEMKLMGADSGTQWWHECLCDGDIWYLEEIEMENERYTKRERHNVNLAEGWELREQRILTKDFYEAYLQWCTKQGVRRKLGKNTLLAKMRGLCLPFIRRRFSRGDRRLCVEFPSLEKCRSLFDRYTKHNEDWI